MPIVNIILGSLRPKHMLKVLNELKGDKTTFLLVRGFRVPEYEEKMYYSFMILYKYMFEKLVKNSIFRQVELLFEI